ncbi:MAG: hypothetical protein IPG06_22255 [Haliea sp.]|nr:hypothetical protein [Haliea sp.]
MRNSQRAPGDQHDQHRRDRQLGGRAYPHTAPAEGALLLESGRQAERERFITRYRIPSTTLVEHLKDAERGQRADGTGPGEAGLQAGN